ncbi:MAG TPA: MarR family transcriptional regulator [Acidimicrobiales bacterium]
MASGSRPRHRGAAIAGAPVGSLLLQVVRAHAQLGTSLLREAGLTPPHEIVLLHLDENGPLPQSEIVHYMGRDRSTVTNTLQAMERAGLVARSPSPEDGRAVVVSLTPRGRRMVPAARDAWSQLEAATTRALSEAQRRTLADALTAVRDELARALDEAAR